MSRVSGKPGTGPEHPTTSPEHPQPPPEQHLMGWIPRTPLITKKNKQKIINESKNIMILVLFSLILIFCLCLKRNIFFVSVFHFRFSADL